ncbi:MAG: hypothetical protein IPH62_00845 [Ignavibacteriae bacterium]|nr:hypothetical protein [Ignavibacteriota bacterium]
MKYKASWKFTSGYKYIFVILFVLFIVSGIVFREVFLLLIGFSVLIYFLFLPFRLFVVLNDDELIFQSWFKKSKVKITEIKSIAGYDSFTFIETRLFGSFTYKICNNQKCFMLNTIYFNPEFRKKFISLCS